ncbi:MAG: hypothetical protein FWH55_06890 [Oscillospiraceae bacterium]|nr:hypothetical protein [Oscillospiraceae bacterium]
MSWDDVIDVVFDGSTEQVDMVKCPECNGDLRISYYPKTQSMEIRCKACGTIVREHGIKEKPRFSSIL